MKKNFRIAMVAAICGIFAVACLALAGCGSSDTNQYKLVEQGKITVGCSPDYQPMEYLEDGKITGFSYGLMEEVAKRCDLELNFLSPQSFDTLITQVAGGNSMDVAVSSITINDERLEEVDFSEPYYDSNLAIVVMKDSKFKSKDDLKNAKVGAQSGTSGEDWIKENLKNADYTPFQETPDALAALRAGKVEALVYDEPVAANHVANEYKDCVVLDTIATGEQYGIAINKENKALTEAINKALADMQSDGTMDKLKATYIEGSGK